MAEQFGPYLLQEVIGRGGMGVVFRAFDTRRDRTVALKRLPRELAGDEHFQARFRRESRLAARLNEPHIIPIHDFGEIDGQLYLDMRLVEGLDLGALIEREGGTLSPELAVDVIGQVAAALAAAHAEGLMHRDIKPSNVLVTGLTDADRSSPFAYLVDFGIARAIGTEGTALTTTSDWFGTVAYMAPERISGSSGDARSDIYSLACLLYHCLTGRAPFSGEALQVLYAHVNNAPPSATALQPGVPPGLDAVMRRGMAKRPEDRYQSVAQLASAARASVGRGGTTGAIRAAAPAVPPHAGPVTSVPPNAAPVTSFPPQAAPVTSFPPRSGPANSLPPRSAAADSFPPRSGPANSVPPRSATTPPRSGGGSSRAVSIMVAVAVVVIIAAMIAVVIAINRHDSGSNAPPAPSTGATGSGSFAPSSSGSLSGSSSAPSTGSTLASDSPTAWARFSGFNRLIGDTPGSTATAYRGATCLVRDGGTVAGLVEQVTCTKLRNSNVTFTVGRFASAAAVDQYVQGLVDKQYSKRYWTIDQKRRGLLLTSPSSDTFADVTSSICAAPTLLVQFYSPSGLSPTQLNVQYWADARFPDIDPAVCD